MMHLGAKKVEVEHVVGWSKEMSLNAGLNLPVHGVPVGGEVSGSKI
jgi:hypothetical protein